MLDTLLAFVPVAAVVTMTPGAATALVMRSALHGGVREGLAVIAGNSIGVVAWALASVAGISAVVSASDTAFSALKLAGALVLLVLGVQALRRARVTAAGPVRVAADRGGAFVAGLVSSASNPKLALFYLALLPQFLPRDAAVVPATLLMAALLVAFDVVWFTSLAVAVARAQKLAGSPRFSVWAQRASGIVLIALAVVLALHGR